MILAPDDQVLERLQGAPAPTQDQFPAEPVDQAKAFGDAASKAAFLGLGVIPFAAQAGHELAQPGGLHAAAHAFGAGFTAQQEVNNFSADRLTMARQYEPIMEAINRQSAPERFLPNPYDATQNADLRQVLEDEIWSRVQDLRKSNPESVANIPSSRAQLLDEVLAEQRRALDDADASSSKGLSGGVGGFAGSMVGSLSDTPNILAMMLGVPASASLLKTFLVEGGVNTALDLAGLPGRAERYKKIGRPMDAREIAGELAGDFVLGGLLPAGVKAALHAFHPDVRSAGQVVEDMLHRADENPHAGDAAGQDLMRQNSLTAMNALSDGRPDLLPDTQSQLARAYDPAIDAARRREGFTVESFDPAAVTTDAAAMQYKGGADAAGVTDRLQGVTQWDPAKAGLSLIWERNEGQLVIADGHQRLGLAQRLAAEGQGDVNLFGLRYREADGFTAQNMRVIAALKNIAEGSGSGIDAARLLREAPAGIKELPPRSPLVRQARDLASLSDDAFGMTLNGHVSERDAALVGRLVQDKTLQAPILSHLAKDSPDTAEEAEIFIRQALAAGATHEVQGDMFGEFIKSDLILPLRVKILKNALTTLRKDKALFATLTDKAGEIEAAGNRLNAAENAARGETAARAFATLKALAERKGPISDALQRAAEQAAKGDRSGALKGFLADVRAAVARGELDGPGAGEAIGHVESEAADAAIPLRPESPGLTHHDLSLFDKPVEKPKGLIEQSQAIARDLAPAPEAPIEPKPGEAVAPPEFGPAQAEVEAIRALDQKDMFPDPAGEGETSVREARRQMERDARAVEALRKCGGFDAD